jgi:hypothetical protein
MNVIIVTFDDGSQIATEGFGTQTIIGVVTDVLSGSYEPKRGLKPVKIEIGEMLDDNETGDLRLAA